MLTVRLAEYEYTDFLEKLSESFEHVFSKFLTL